MAGRTGGVGAARQLREPRGPPQTAVSSIRASDTALAQEGDEREVQER